LKIADSGCGFVSSIVLMKKPLAIARPGPQPIVLPDPASSLRRQYRSHYSSKIRNLDASFHVGTITISGEVATFFLRQLALTMASNVARKVGKGFTTKINDQMRVRS
jgi:hypothetical protein